MRGAHQIHEAGNEQTDAHAAGRVKSRFITIARYATRGPGSAQRLCVAFSAGNRETPETE